MRNWLGQQIEVGTTVYRGARQGNGSEYKVGVVESLNEDKGTAKVHWQYEPHGYFWRKDAVGNNERIRAIGTMDSHGSPDINSLVVIDLDLARLQARADLAQEWRDTGMPTDLYEDRLEELDGGEI